jgi:putative FmdB family regulatory protein
MPLYEYQCDGCGHRFELIQKYSDPPPDHCPKCSGTVKKLLSSPAIQFKGSGWYITDYARAGKADGASTPAGKSEGGTSSSDSKATSSSDTKSETKTESKSDGKTDTKKTEGKPATS